MFQSFPSQAQKTTEILLSKRKYLHYFPEVPITSPKKTRKSRFQKKDIGIIFQRFPSQAQKTTEIPFSNRRYWHYFPKAPITNPKNHGNPFSNRRYCLTTNGEAEKTMSNRRYSLYQPQILRTRLCDKPFFK